MTAMRHTATGDSRRRRTGIALVETTFALVILSVGILAVFALFSRGLERGGESEADLHVALFADNVLEGLQAAALKAAQDNPENGWDEFWKMIGWNGNESSIAAHPVWADAADDPFNPVIMEAGLLTNVYRMASLRETAASNMVHHAIRYRLDTEPIPASDHRVNRAVTLRVWPGRYGSTSAVPPRVFYTEYRKPDFF